MNEHVSYDFLSQSIVIEVSAMGHIDVGCGSKLEFKIEIADPKAEESIEEVDAVHFNTTDDRSEYIFRLK